MRQIFVYLALISIFAVAAKSAQAAEVSWVQGGFSHEENDDGMSRNQLGFGVRYADQWQPHSYWFTEGVLQSNHYGGRGNLDSHTGVKLGGGVRYYFDRMTDSLVPFANGYSHFGQEEVSGGMEENRIFSEIVTGITYGADVGLRLSLSKDFFLDFESALFNSHFIGKRVLKTASKGADGYSKAKRDIDRQELMFAGKGEFPMIKMALGLRL